MRNIEAKYDQLDLNIFKQIVEQSPNSIVITDLDGKIKYVNPMFTEITGYSLEDVINQNPRILNAGTQQKEYYTEMWETITSNEIWFGEFHNKKKNGELYWEKVKIAPIRYRNGLRTHYLGIKEDITKLKETEALFKEFVSNSPAVVYFKDLKGRFINVNSKFRELFDNMKLEIIGKTDYDLFPKELADNFRKHDKIIIQTGKPITIEEKAINNKQIHHYISTKFPSKDANGKVKGICGISVDITKLKNTELTLEKQYAELKIAKQKADESNQLKTEFLQNISHEIRTPMNVILGFSNLLIKPNLTNEERDIYISNIKNSGNQLLQIIEDILEISRLKTKQEKITEKNVCINSMFADLFLFFGIRAKEKGLTLNLKKGLSDKKSTILTDETKLNKIICNLLENALKFTNEGFIEFGYQLKETIPETPLLQIYVKDTGIGISPENHKIIFKRFSQEEKELSKTVGGLGLGLSIAKENATLLGGEITVQSEKGKGATFFVSIPYKQLVSEYGRNEDKELSKENNK